MIESADTEERLNEMVKEYYSLLRKTPIRERQTSDRIKHYYTEIKTTANRVLSKEYDVSKFDNQTRDFLVERKLMIPSEGNSTNNGTSMYSSDNSNKGTEGKHGGVSKQKKVRDNQIYKTLKEKMKQKHEIMTKKHSNNQ